MSFYSQTGKTIEETFKKFHQENPVIYQQFIKYFHECIAKGRKKTSSKMIINRIRWEVYVETTGTPYKINDCFTSHYSRKFVKEFTQYKDYFEFRKLKAITIEESIPVDKNGQGLLFGGEDND